LKLDEPVVVVGDLHGQYYDLVHMLEKAGDPFKTGYIFLGDYVDRGIFSIETTLLLFAFKVTVTFNILDQSSKEFQSFTWQPRVS
jgi:serine/threonine-protein phosphatase 2B catalytic subunit